MNRLDIREEVRRLIRDTDSTSGRYTDTILNSRINQSHERISVLAKCIPDIYTANIVSGTAEYTLPDYYALEEDVLWLNSSAEYRALEKKTEKEMDIQFANWRNETSDTIQAYYIRGGTIGFYPKPNYSLTNGFRIYMTRKPYSATPADDLSLSNDASVPFGSESKLYPYHDIICFDVSQRCRFDEGKLEDVRIFEAEIAKRLRELRSAVSSEGEYTRIINVYESARSNSRRSR